MNNGTFSVQARETKRKMHKVKTLDMRRTKGLSGLQHHGRDNEKSNSSALLSPDTLTTFCLIEDYKQMSVDIEFNRLRCSASFLF